MLMFSIGLLLALRYPFGPEVRKVSVKRSNTVKTRRGSRIAEHWHRAAAAVRWRSVTLPPRGPGRPRAHAGGRGPLAAAAASRRLI